MKHSKLLLAAGLVMVLAALAVSPAAAGDGPTLHSITMTSFDCSTRQVAVSITMNGYNNQNHTVSMTNTTTGASTIAHNSYHVSGVFTESFSGTFASLSAGDSIQVTSAYGSYNQTVTATVNCDVFDDGRINLQPWAKAVAYCSEEDGIKIYQAAKDGKVGLLMHVTAATLAALPAKPATNTLIKQVGNVSLYKLTTGEYQMNVGPDSEGKTQVFIWRGCNRSTEYYRELQASSHAPYARMGGWQAL